MTGDVETDREDLAKRLCVQLLAEVMAAKPLDVCALRAELMPADLELLDRPTAVIFEVAVGLARRGIAPSALEVHAALMNAGALGSSTSDLGQSVKDRMLRAATSAGYAERLFDTAANLLTVIFRNRLASWGSALEAASWGMAVPDAWELLCREGAAARNLHERVGRLETVCGRPVGTLAAVEAGQFELPGGEAA